MKMFTFASEIPYRRYDENFGSFNEILLCQEENLRKERLDLGMNVIFSHDQKKPVGLVKEYKIKDHKVWAGIDWSSSDFSQQVKKDFEDGILPNVSIDYIVHKYEKIGEDWYAVDWELLALSVGVSIPADPTVGVRDLDKRNILFRSIPEYNEEMKRKKNMKLDSEETETKEMESEETETKEMESEETEAEETETKETEAEETEAEETEAEETEAEETEAEETEAEETEAEETEAEETEAEETEAEETEMSKKKENKVETKKREYENFLGKKSVIKIKEKKIMSGLKELGIAARHLAGLGGEGLEIVGRSFEGCSGPFGRANNNMLVRAFDATNGVGMLNTEHHPTIEPLIRQKSGSALSVVKFYGGLRGTVEFPDQQSASTVGVNGLDDALGKSQPKVGKVTLTAKKLGVEVEVPESLWVNSVPEAIGAVVNDAILSWRQKLENVMLLGGGTILGINTTVGVLTANIPDLSVATWSDFGRMAGVVGNYNLGTAGFIISGSAAVSQKFNPRDPGSGRMVNEDNTIGSMKVYENGDLPNSKGFYGDLSKIVIGEFANGLEVMIDNITGRSVGLIKIYVSGYVDVGLFQPARFVKTIVPEIYS